MNFLKGFFLAILFLFSHPLLASNCFKFKNSYEITFFGNGNNGCTSDQGLNVYSHNNINQTKFLKDNGRGYTISMTFIRNDYDIAAGNEIILFGAYSDIAASNAVLELGIDSNDNLFVNRPNEKINLAITTDSDITEAYTLILSYYSLKKQLILTVNGAEAIENNIDPISVEVKRIIIGKNFKGKIGPITGFSNKFGLLERSIESNRIAAMYRVPISPLKKISKLTVSEKLCTSSQIEISNSINKCLSTTEAFSSNPLDPGMTVPTGSKLTIAGTFPLICDPGYDPSDPSPTYTVDANGNITSIDGSCNTDQCNILNIPVFFSLIPTVLDFGDYIESTTLNCVSGDIDMNGNTDCIAVSNIGEITTYVNNLIAIPTIIDNTIRQNIKDASDSVDDSTIDTTIDAILASNNNYDCPVNNIPAGFAGNITSPLTYGTNQNFNCIADYIGSTNLNCTDGLAIDMSGNIDCSPVSTTGEITTYINALIAVPTIIDNIIRQNIKDASSIDDATIDTTIDAILTSNSNYDCSVTGHAGITDPTNINYGNTILNCEGLLGYNGGSIDFDCQAGGTAIVTSGSCNIMTVSEAEAFIAASAAPGDDFTTLKSVTGITDGQITTALASNGNYDCNVSAYPSPNFFNDITLPITHGTGQSFTCDVGFTGSGISGIDCIDSIAIDLSTGGDCTVRSYNVGTGGTDLDITNSPNSNITYDAIYKNNYTNSSSLGISCNIGYEPSDSQNFIEYQFNNITGDIETNVETCITRTYTAGTDYTLPANAIDPAISYNPAINIGNPQNFSCNLGYEASGGLPNYYFDGSANVVIGGGSCIAKTYIAGTDYTLPTNADNPGVISFNPAFISPTYSSGSGATDGIPCSSGYEPSDSDPDNMIRYRFNATTSNIELNGETCEEVTLPFGGRTEILITHAAGDSRLINPVQVEGKWYYFWDGNDNGSSCDSGRSPHYSVENGDQTELIHIDSLLAGGPFSSSDITGTMTELGTESTVQVKLVTVGSSNTNNTSDTGDITHSGTSFDRNGSDDGLATNSTYNGAATIWDGHNGSSTNINISGIPTGWCSGRFLTGTYRNSNISTPVTFEFNNGKSDNYYSNDPAFIMFEVLN